MKIFNKSDIIKITDDTYDFHTIILLRRVNFMDNTMNLSSSMEDYLEAILLIAQKEGTARISDIAGKLDVAASSVNEVVKKLANLKLVKQEKYGPVILTKNGEDYAKKILCRHKIIKKFLTNILEVDEKIAEKDACMMEHVVSSVTMERLADFLVNTNNIALNNVCLNQYFNKAKDREQTMITELKSLNELSVGDYGEVIKITARGNMKKKFLDMGLLPGVNVNVRGKAPLGYPVEINIKGYNLSLREEEAKNIYIKKIN